MVNIIPLIQVCAFNLLVVYVFGVAFFTARMALSRETAQMVREFRPSMVFTCLFLIAFTWPYQFHKLRKMRKIP